MPFASAARTPPLLGARWPQAGLLKRVRTASGLMLMLMLMLAPSAHPDCFPCPPARRYHSVGADSYTPCNQQAMFAGLEQVPQGGWPPCLAPSAAACTCAPAPGRHAPPGGAGSASSTPGACAHAGLLAGVGMPQRARRLKLCRRRRCPPPPPCRRRLHALVRRPRRRLRLGPGRWALRGLGPALQWRRCAASLPARWRCPGRRLPRRRRCCRDDWARRSPPHPRQHAAAGPSAPPCTATTSPCLPGHCPPLAPQAPAARSWTTSSRRPSAWAAWARRTWAAAWPRCWARARRAAAAGAPPPCLAPRLRRGARVRPLLPAPWPRHCIRRPSPARCPRAAAGA
jgi:hypothetical protein